MLNDLFSKTMAGQIMDSSGGGLANLLGGTLGAQAIQGMQGEGGMPITPALLGLLSPMLTGQGQQQQPQVPMMGAQNPMAGGMPQAGQQQPQMGADATQTEGQTMTPLERQTRMRRYQSAMRAAEAAKSGDIMSLVQTLIMESD